VTFFLIFALLLRRFNQNSVANIILIFLLASFQDFIILFLSAWTEQLYTVFIIANCFLLVKHQFDPKWIYFAGAIILAGMAMITRYIGITMGALLILYALLLAEPQLQLNLRFRRYVFPSLLAFIPFMYLLWMDTSYRGADLANLGLVQVKQGGVFAYSIGSYPVISTTIDTLKAFWRIAGQPYVILAFMLLLFILFFRRKTLDHKSQELLRLMLFFLLGYLALTIGAYFITGPALKTRYLAPLVFFVFLGVAQIIGTFSKNIFIFIKSVTTRAAILVVLFAVLLYPLFFQALGVENILVDRVRDARENSLRQVQGGFNLSPTAEKFRDFFEQISKNYNQNTIVVIDGDYNYNRMTFGIDSDSAKPFLLKSSIISSPQVSEFRFFGVQDRQQYLSYYYNEHYTELHLIIPTGKTILETIHQLEQSIQGNIGSLGIFFIINEQWFNLFADEELGGELDKLQPIAHIDPYLIFELRPAHSLNN